LLPLLCVADVFAVIAYRRHAEARQLFSLVPWVLVGMAPGALALSGPESVLRPGGRRPSCWRWWCLRLRRRPRPPADDRPPARNRRPAPVDRLRRRRRLRHHAGQRRRPVMNLYLLARRLPKQQFIATGAWFFLVINLSKLPIYAGHG
jgi:hypothetical protein